MNVRKLALPLLAIPLVLAACDGGGGGAENGGNLVPADPAYFDGQVFQCGNPGEPPTCPPGVCDVDVNGAVSGCDGVCNTSGAFTNCTAFNFTGPQGLDLCVPSQCTVEMDGTTGCTQDCAEDDVTCYVMDLFESTCG